MRNTTVLLLIMMLGFLGTAHAQLKSASQRQQYREAVELENRTDHTGARQHREDRRDMLRDGVPLEQVQEEQLDRINRERTAPQPDFSGDAAVNGTFNSPYMGVSSPKKKDGGK